MNAYELADIVDRWAYKESAEYLTDAAKMLRQQADRIAELEKSSMAWYEAGKFVSPQIKELSDEEIYKLAEYHGLNDWLYETSVPDFARAILKKASEK